jgi:hypothetical protein
MRIFVARVNFQRRDATAQQIAAGKSNWSMLLVYDVSVFPPRLVGHANTNEEARALVK